MNYILLLLLLLFSCKENCSRESCRSKEYVSPKAATQKGGVSDDRDNRIEDSNKVEEARARLRAAVEERALLEKALEPYSKPATPPLTVTDVKNAKEWIIDCFGLRGVGSDDYRWSLFGITISPNGKYAMVGISKGGSIYRFMICNPLSREVYYNTFKDPEDLGYAFHEVKFSQDSKECAFVCGYRSIVIVKVSLPEGQRVWSKDIDMSDDYSAVLDGLF